MNATQSPDLERLERDARARIGELERQERRLSLDALADPAMAEELKDVQSQRAAALAAIRQAELARDEREHREVQAREEAERARLRAHFARARELQVEIDRVIKTVDKRLAEAMTALREYVALATTQQQELSAAGERPPRTPPWMGNAVLAFAMQRADLPRGVIVLETTRAAPGPLSELHPRPALEESE
ncbi:MAG TPA: hypothetical protein VEJ23_07150 [Solirubrobacteraceae bacterium]|nr:hypothetical protein [Solirubrobacteraceae bacterium]